VKPARGTILVVDDHEGQRELVATQLEMEGFEVETAESGEECLELCETLSPDVILLDIEMPGMGGIEACKRLKATPELAEIPVLFLTGWKDNDELTVKALNAGGNDFVVKTASPQVLIARVQSQALIRQSQIRLAQMAMFDELTGLYTRRFLFDALRRNLKAQSRSDSHGLGCLIADIDHFKQINDTLGHLEGDRALQRVATCLKEGLRETDVVARFGGEEFVVLLPGVSVETAREMGEKLRARVADKTPSTISVGVAWVDTHGFASNDEVDSVVQTLLSRADRAMYQAKEQGRNRVCDWEAITPA
jgi:diguanylate cyclase (GGDEF)-like protein